LRWEGRSGTIALMQKKAANRRPKVVVALAEGFVVFEFGIVCEIFGSDYSDLAPNWYRLVLCAATPSPLRSSTGLTVDVPRGLEALRGAHTVIVPPYGPAHEPPEDLVAALVAAHRRGARIVSICTGAFALGAAGLLDGRAATTHWHHAGQLAEMFPAARVDPNVLYIDDGDVLTSAGAAAGIDLCLHIVRRDFGAEVANTIARNLVVPPHRDGGQAQFVCEPFTGLPSSDPFADTLVWVQERLGESLSVEDLARRSAMSPRTFARRFVATTGTTPHRWLIRQRVLLAQRLLETTDLGIDEIANRAGFGSATNLRQHFRSEVLASPAAYRRTFRQISA
jgi:AraC family transcriptional activator FtrA